MAPGKLVENFSVSDVTVEYVKPLSAGTHREFGVLHLTGRDLRFKNFMCPAILAYRDGKNNIGDSLEKVRRMKTALSKTLDLFYPAAGRYVSDPTTVGSGSENFKADPKHICNDAGVPFVEAYADHVLDDVLPTGRNPNLGSFDVVQVSELYIPAQDMFGKDLRPGDGPFDRELPEDGLPALAIQVTRFKCGGVVLAPVYPHMLMDACSFADFMKAWSEMSVLGKTTIVPDFHREWIVVPNMKLPPLGEMRKAEAPFIRRVFEVSRSAIETMKQEVTRETNGSRYVSTVDCISAHFWYSLVRLTSIAPDLSGWTVSSYGSAEGRATSRDPKLPRYLFGNVIKPILHPLLPPGELLAKPASSAALRLRDHIKSENNPQGWRSAEVMEHFYRSVFLNKSAGVWCTTSLIAFPIYETEFDLLGKPSFACPASLNALYKEGDFGRAVLYPPLPSHKNQSSSTAHLEINPKWLDILCSDACFMSLFLDNEPRSE